MSMRNLHAAAGMKSQPPLTRAATSGDISPQSRRLNKRESRGSIIPLQRPQGVRNLEDKKKFFAECQEELQAEFAKALDDTVEHVYGWDPVANIGRKLLECKKIDTRGLNMTPEKENEIDEKVRPFVQRQGSDPSMRTPSPQPSSSTQNDEDGPPQWSMKHWLASLNLDEKIYNALRQPVVDSTDGQQGDPDSAKENEEFLFSCLGQMQSCEPILRLLQECDLLYDLASEIHKSAIAHHKAELAEAAAKVSGKDDGAFGAASKFFEADSAASALNFGSVATFYEGLDGFIGPPNPNLGDAMRNEHCEGNDARNEFVVPNYHTKTTSRTEYWFVAEPSEEKLAELKLGAWPTENTRRAQEHQQRKPLMPAFFEGEMNERNGQLIEKGLEQVVEEELIAARLYTGPMYVKYNWVLRSIGTLKVDSSVSESDLKMKLVNKGEEDFEHLIERAKMRGELDSHGTRMDTTGRTFGNLYTTTLHVISSAVLKLGKLTRASKVYRGISMKTMPQRLQTKDASSNTRGGVEYGFLSCSTQKQEALQYALGKTPLLLELQQGMIDRGADLSWLSQYPHEKEVMFPPLTGLEFLYHSVEDGQVLVVTVRPSVNLKSLTFEQVVAKMRSSHVQLLDLLTDNLVFAGVPTTALQPLIDLKKDAKHREPSWFNSTHNYREATDKAIMTQSMAFKALSGGGVGGSSSSSSSGGGSGSGSGSGSGEAPIANQMEPEKIYAAAELAASAGEHEVAIDLLLLRRGKLIKAAKEAAANGNGGGSETRLESLAAIAEELLLIKGGKQPWPPTLVLLASETDASGKPKAAEHCLQMAEVQRIVSEALQKQKDEGRGPFEKNAKVLVCPDARKAIWVKARVKDGPFKGSPKYDEREPDTLKYSGVQYEIEGLAGEQSRRFYEEQVVSPTMHGVPELLGIAAEQGDVVLVKTLLDANANPFCTNLRASTALVRMAEKGKIDERDSGKIKVIELLLERFPSSAFYDMRNIPRQNAFDLAAMKSSMGAIRSMQKSNRFCPSDLEYTPDESQMFLQLREREEDKNKTSLKHNQEWDSGVTTLMLSIRLIENAAERLEVVKCLLGAKADVNATSKDGVTALMFAVDDNRPDIVEELIDKGANANQQDANNRTPLVQAAQLGFLEVAQILIKAGGIEALMYQRQKKRSVLTYAAQYGHVAVARTVLEFADRHGKKEELLNMTNKGSGEESALTFAARNGQTEMVKLLLAQGINIEQETSLEKEAVVKRDGAGLLQRMVTFKEGMVLGEDEKKEKVVKGYWTSLHRACANGHKETAIVLLNRLPKLLDFGSDKKATPLIAAATSGHLQSVMQLVEYHPPGSEEAEREKQTKKYIRMVNEEGQTALWMAAANGHVDVVRYLASKDNSKEHIDTRAEYSAQQAASGGRKENVKEEVAVRRQPMSALMVAALSGHDRVVRALHGVHPAAVEPYTNVSQFVLTPDDVGKMLTIEKEHPDRFIIRHGPFIDGESGAVSRSLTAPLTRKAKIEEELKKDKEKEKKKEKGLPKAEKQKLEVELEELKTRLSLTMRSAFWDRDATPKFFDSVVIKDVAPRNVPGLTSEDREREELVVTMDNGQEFICPRGGFDDALLLATRHGHKAVVRVLCSISKARSRSMDAEEVAKLRLKEMDKQAEEEAAKAAKAKAKAAPQEQKEMDGQDVNDEQRKIFKEILTLVSRPNLIKERTKTVYKSRRFSGLSENEEANLAGQIHQNNDVLKWTGGGQMLATCPPRPTPEELTAGKTPYGHLVFHNGLVMQPGPFNSMWLRACTSNVERVGERVPWHKLWLTLHMHVSILCQERSKPGKEGAVYVAVSARSMGAVDFKWLADQGFTFHHYQTNVKRSEVQSSNALDLYQNAELVYYCWPPAVSKETHETAINGGVTARIGLVTGLVFSCDEACILLVWENGAWCPPVASADVGETRLDAFEREVLSATRLRLDKGWPSAQYLGGWLQRRPRDGVVEDAFGVFTAKCADEPHDPDDDEVVQTRWVEWRPLLATWKQAGSPKDGKTHWKLPAASASFEADLHEGDVFLVNALHWLDTYDSKRGFALDVESASHQPTDIKVVTAKINTLH